MPDFRDIVQTLELQTRFATDDELRQSAQQLLEAGYAVEDVARVLSINAGIIYQFLGHKNVREAVRRGQVGRATALQGRLLLAANQALDVAVSLLQDSMTPPDVRAKIAADLLDRALGKATAAGLSDAGSGPALGVQVNIDNSFRDRLAQRATHAIPSEVYSRPTPQALTGALESQVDDDDDED